MFHVFRDDARRRLTITLSGAISFSDFARFLTAQRSQDAWGYGVLYDARNATTNLSEGDLASLATHVGELNRPQPRGPVAVAGTEEWLRALVKAYAALMMPLGVEVALFDDVPSAEEWLDDRVGGGQLTGN